MTKPTPTPDRAGLDEIAAAAVASLRPFHTAVEGFSAGEHDWPNTVAVSTAERVNPGWQQITDGDPERAAAESGWAADTYSMQVVRVDTNYKPTRESDYPADLSRTGAVELVVALLQALEDTFHAGRVGQLRPGEAGQLLRELDNVETVGASVRSHALDDLLLGAGLDPDFPDFPSARSGDDHTAGAGG